MGKHRGRGNGGGLRQVSLRSQTQPKSDYQHGPHYRGEGSTFLSDEISRREYTPELCDGELLVLLVLNRQAWQARGLIVEASASFIALQLRPVRDLNSLPRDKKGKRKVPGERTIERYLRKLTGLGYLRLHRKGHEKEGNTYFVEPVFIWSSKWHELAGIETAHCISTSGEYPNIWLERWYRQNGGTEVGTAKMAARYRQNGGTCAASPGSGYRQNGGDLRSRSSDPTAQRVTAPKTIEGGVESPSSEGERRSPNRHDRKSGTKGDGLTAVSINVAELPTAEITAHCEAVRSKHKRRRQMSREDQLAYTKSQREEAT